MSPSDQLRTPLIIAAEDRQNVAEKGHSFSKRRESWAVCHGVSGPNGQHLVELIRNSDEVLDVLLLLAGRQQVAAAKKLVDVRNKLAETIQQVDELMGEGRPKA